MINWSALLVVQLVSFASTIVVAVLTALAVLGLSARSARTATADRHLAPTSPRLSVRSGTALGATCLVLAALIVLFGLWEIVAR